MVAHAYPYFVEHISPSMVKSVFSELKANGYSDAQIAALSSCLMEMAHSDMEKNGSPAEAGSQSWRDADSNPSFLGLPEEFESLYLAGLM